MRNAVVRRPSNKGLFGKASSTRVARRPTNITVMTPANQAERSRWYDDQEYRREGRPIPRPIEIHYHHTHVEKRDWGHVVGLAGGIFAAAALGLMLLPLWSWRSCSRSYSWFWAPALSRSQVQHGEACR